MRTVYLKEDALDSWALVELYRWQHGDLPDENYKPLNIDQALLNCAKNMGEGNVPEVFNVMSVLDYLGRTYNFD